MRDMDKRLKALEARAGQAQGGQGVMTLRQWCDGYAGAPLPDTPAVHLWQQKADVIRAQCAETMAIFEV